MCVRLALQDKSQVSDSTYCKKSSLNMIKHTIISDKGGSLNILLKFVELSNLFKSKETGRKSEDREAWECKVPCHKYYIMYKCVTFILFYNQGPKERIQHCTFTV